MILDRPAVERRLAHLLVAEAVDRRHQSLAGPRIVLQKLVLVLCHRRDFNAQRPGASDLVRNRIVSRRVAMCRPEVEAMVIRTRWSARPAIRYLCRPPPRRHVRRAGSG